MKRILTLLGFPDEAAIRASERNRLAGALEKDCIIFDVAGGYVPANEIMGETLRELARQLVGTKPINLHTLQKRGQEKSLERRKAHLQSKAKEK